MDDIYKNFGKILEYRNRPLMGKITTVALFKYWDSSSLFLQGRNLTRYDKIDNLTTE
jgi:hypothetical protein